MEDDVCTECGDPADCKCDKCDVDLCFNCIEPKTDMCPSCNRDTVASIYDAQDDPPGFNFMTGEVDPD